MPDLPNFSPAINLRHVNKTYHGKGKRTEALHGLDLVVGQNEFVSIVGPSGCGKSTALMLMAGLDVVDAGVVQVAGRQVTRPDDRIGIVFQDPTLLPWKSVIENVLYPARIRGIAIETVHEQAVALLELLGLEKFHDRLPHELSGGMRQRVSICRALTYSPDILLLDEPFSALDALTREEMNQLLLAITESLRRTVVLITHNISEALLLSDRVLVMSARPGRIIEDLAVPFDRPRNISEGPVAQEFRYLKEHIRRIIAGTRHSAETQLSSDVFKQRLDRLKETFSTVTPHA